MIDIDALEALAKAATPGPWTVDEECLTDRGCLYVAKGKPGDLRGRVLEVFKNCLVRDAGRASNAEFIAAANPAAILALIAEVRALREDAELFRLLVSTCDALDANAFDKTNQPGTLRITVKHKTQTYPELRMKIIDFLKGYKERADAARGAK